MLMRKTLLFDLKNQKFKDNIEKRNVEKQKLIS